VTWMGIGGKEDRGGCHHSSKAAEFDHSLRD
jgi:hypothetical protein